MNISLNFTDSRPLFKGGQAAIKGRWKGDRSLCPRDRTLERGSGWWNDRPPKSKI